MFVCLLVVAVNACACASACACKYCLMSGEKKPEIEMRVF